MDFKINPSVYTSMCPIPVSVIDENIKLASASQLKTILYFFRKSTTGEVINVEDISKAIGYDKEDCEDALIYWSERGILIKENDEVDFTAPAVNPTNDNSQKAENIVSEIPNIKPSFDQVEQRLNESEDLKLLFNEINSMLGKTIGFSGQSTILMIHDNYGLPVEVILMLVSYAKSIGSIGMAQISSLAKKWADKEIFSVELAEEYIDEQTRVDSIWKSFKTLSGVKNEYPTTKQREYFNKWSKVYNMSVEMIYYAYEISIEQTSKFSLPYVDKILKNWFDSKFKSVEDVKEYEKNKQNNKSDNVNKNKASYDVSKYKKIGLNLKK